MAGWPGTSSFTSSSWGTQTNAGSSAFSASSLSVASPFSGGASSAAQSNPFASSQSFSSPFSTGRTNIFGSAAPSPNATPFNPFSGQSSLSVFGSSSTSPFGNALLGGNAPTTSFFSSAPAASQTQGQDVNGGAQAPKSQGEKYIEAWKNLEAAAKGGVWPFSGFGVADGEQLFTGLDLSPEEHRFLFHQRSPADWPAVSEQILSSQLQQLVQFHAVVREKALAERLAFDAPPPTAHFFHAFLAGLSLAAGGAAAPSAQLQQATPPPALQASAPSLCPPVAAPPAAAGFGQLAGDSGAWGSAGPQAGLQGDHNAEAEREAKRRAAFAAPQFEPGKIPDVAPPPEVC
ncbi:hypothetical protein BESB_072110 [Besnoitia besnoiti]|uniref:Nucleoporin FG repeat-containing protein n=1 Tax=Besnoitia besnoiti TaxID=94643 RepID=A0A2A9M810_BESBE|nr:uncharacterized protein BESB_072110 [Besnoitia besnoiti]PFH34059.1 hypothetical protein BESB_072110 [Besnoitia besnoiti]